VNLFVTIPAAWPRASKTQSIHLRRTLRVMHRRLLLQAMFRYSRRALATWSD
jgi:hypothetical protein